MQNETVSQKDFVGQERRDGKAEQALGHFQVQYLNVGWAEIVSVDHIPKFLHIIVMVGSCVEIWWWKEIKRNWKLESNLRKLFTRRVLKW